MQQGVLKFSFTVTREKKPVWDDPHLLGSPIGFGICLYLKARIRDFKEKMVMRFGFESMHGKAILRVWAKILVGKTGLKNPH